jgi:FKBP-type peptidyl-prolyl cis-trans isomerase FkpA
MKRIALIPVLAGVLLFGACNKESDNNLSGACGPVTTTAPGDEVAQLQAYISSNGITAAADSRGFFYTIKAPGDSLKPTVCSNVQVNYAGRLTNGTRFDGANQVSFSLSRLITGWKQGIPLIGEGGSITLYLPPSLGYGATATGNIPANSILIFDIDLLKFN